MIHRHLDYPEGTPIESLDLAALDDLLDHADLAVWRPIAKAVAADPFGPVAQKVLHLCDANPRYGTSPLWRAWIAMRRERRMGQRSPLPQTTLPALRTQRGVTQATLAAAVGMSQSDLSKAERRADPKLSTVRALVSGLGMELRLVAVDVATGERVEVRGIAPNEDTPE